jgi:hypothetical protein
MLARPHDSHPFINPASLLLSETEKQRFYGELEAFCLSKQQTFRATPSLNFKDLNLFELYSFVAHLGGTQAVTSQSQWGDVASALGFDEGCGAQLETAYSK